MNANVLGNLLMVYSVATLASVFAVDKAVVDADYAATVSTAVVINVK
jgi:hypothetical protein